MVNGSYQGVSVCGDCIRNMDGRKFITTDGQGSSGILFLGESPWLDEVKMGRCFAGAAGVLLDSQLRRAGLNRTNVIISNVMWCSPPYLGWVGKHPDSWVALRHCQPYWEKLIEVMQPKVIVTLGEVAMERVLEVSGLDARQAYVHDSRWGIPVIPSYHPAHILRGNQKLTQALYFAINRAKETAAANGQWTREPVNYLVDPPVNEARDYLFDTARYCESASSDAHEASPASIDTLASVDASGSEGEVSDGGVVEGSTVQAGCHTAGGICADSGAGNNPDMLVQVSRQVSQLPSGEQWQWVTENEAGLARRWAGGPMPTIPLLVADIETPNSSRLDEEEREEKDDSYTIIRMSFSVSHATALSIPWSEPYIGLAKEALAAAAVISPHNGDGFDLPRLAYNECSWRGEIHDTMWMWHFLQSDMLKALGFIAPFFTDMPPWKHLSDVDPGYYSACDADAQFRCYVAIRRALEQAGRWQRFVRHCIRCDEIFRRPSVGRIPVDRAAQQVLEARLITERDAALAKLQEQVPLEVRSHKVYKTSRAFDADPDKQFWQVQQHPCPCQSKDEQGMPIDVEDISL